MRVVGIDPSLTRTGVAYIDEDPLRVRCYSLPTMGSRYDSVADTAARIQRIAIDATLPLADGAFLLALEAPAYSRHGASTWDRAGLWWEITRRAVRDRVPVATVAPTTRARWAAGHGHASKARVLAAMRALWPDATIRNHDEADAVALATMAAQHLGWDVPTLAHHPEPLATVTWPDLEDAA